ncbi:MFS transporter [Ktedonobacter sp. SOSP1-85]|uniref:MFS transporter n=1 Tax=Ktedonobacter sp. SOSP1-85 TaxID=2778367 RepID=UPI00191540F6|nr:MFS transporter [Ktedonobacter sp. SOSP1-85]GHO78462.1 MFS transporter [Ktedonobacter sp. SOSP1-85]
MDFFKSLSHRAFALLWSGQTISRLGDSFYTVALAWWGLEKTGSATTMGLVLIFANAPTLLLLLLGGVVVDRFSRLHMMLGSDFARAAIVGVAALLAAMQLLEVWHVLVISALFGVVDAFFYPAYTAIVPEVVPSEALPSANSLRSISARLAGIIGPLLAGLVIAQGGTALAFGFDALSFIVSAICLLSMPRKGALVRTMEAESSVLKDLREGIGTVLASPWLWVTIAVAGLSNLTLSGPLDAAMPLLVKLRFGANAQLYGFILAFEATGSILAAIWLGCMKRLRHRGYLVYLPWMVASLMLFVIGLPLVLVVMCLVMFILGAGTSTLNLVWANSLQELVPDELLGRVSSIDALGSYSLLPIGYALAGIAADHIGPSMTFLVGGLLSVLIVGLGLLHPGVRNID